MTPTAAAARLGRPLVLQLSLLSACCSSDTLARERQRAHDLQARLQRDHDPDAPGPDACADVPLVTLADLARGAHQGERVAVDGTPRPLDFTCTEMLCTDECDRPLPCCNECSSDHMVLMAPGRPPEFFLELRGAGLRCSGLDCAKDCVPFGIAPPRSYRFVGLHSQETRQGASGATVRSKLEVERFCHAPGGER